ncbi:MULTISPECIES: hypothetical protein [unclassified Kribbella]|uniref:hypothetical protein n=1 Tax=unclassified Kribbella TaxID=2644121 RepID=UPI00301AD2FE
MIAGFLAGELDSERFGPELARVLTRHGHPATLLTEPNLSGASENEARRRILGDFRGYGQDRELFEGFPSDVRWQHVLLSPSELLGVRYIDYSYWNALSGGTRRPTNAVPFILGGGLVFGHMPTDQFLAAAEAFRNGLRWQPIICVRASEGQPLVVLEGHLRLTAMALAAESLPPETSVLLGTSQAISDWPCY